MEVIFHADDLGATPEVTRKILDAWQNELINSFSLIVNGTGVRSISEKLNEHPRLEARISVHLNISDGRSSLPPEKVPRLVDRDGFFKYGFPGIFLRVICSSRNARRSFLREIESEWREQIRRAKEICRGRKIRGVDGHIHVHMIPFLFPIAAKLAREEDISEIRIAREFWTFPAQLKRLFSLQFCANNMKWALLRILAVPLFELKGGLGLGGPQAFIGVLNTGIVTRRSVLRSLKRLRKRGVESCEVLFHIGGASEEEVAEWKPLEPTFKFLTSDGRDAEYRELEKLRACMNGEIPDRKTDQQDNGGVRMSSYE